MSKNVVLRDTRVEGTMKTGHLLKEFAVHKDYSLIPVFYELARLAKTHGKIGTLFVVGHGYQDRIQYGELGFWYGGAGIQLGKEDLMHHNYNLWAAVTGSVKNIVIAACGAAGPPTKSGAPDGKFLLASLARTTNAVVYGADVTQWYSTKGMDFGGWEGNLYCFLPTGQNFIVPSGEIANGLADHQA
jgi:hypothetical protein